MKEPIVYIVSSKTCFSDEEIALISRYLPDSRIKKADKYLRPIDRNNCIISYFLLLYGLIKNFGIKSIPKTDVGEFGRPFFIENDIYFSISHCSSGVCCGIAGQNIGTDIENINVHFSDIIDIVMSEREIRRINCSASPYTEFTKLWTLKESICKFYATGIDDNLKSLDFFNVDGDTFSHSGLMFRAEIKEDYCLSACTKDTAPVFIAKTPKQYLDDFFKLYTL